MLDPSADYSYVMKEGKHYPGERIWLDLQPWLKSCGYTLRDRYQPGWIASWLKPGAEKDWTACEDSLVPDFSHLLDASREDGSHVMLKHISTSRHPDEVEIGQLFSSQPLASNQKNCCVPFYDVLRIPDDDDGAIIVMPLLYRIGLPPFQTIGEMVEFFRQIFEGLQLMHQHHIAHRDCKYNNIMADSSRLYDFPPHPYNRMKKRDFSGYANICSSRTLTPIRYYLVDFGLSRRYNPEDGPPLALPRWGGDKSVPEFAAVDTPCDPFPVDVYCLGNAIRQYFLEGFEIIPGKRGLDFMKNLVADMVHEDPKQRPTMDEVVARFENIIKHLSEWKLRSRLGSKEEGRLRRVTRSIVHWTKQIIPIVRRIPPIPTP